VGAQDSLSILVTGGCGLIGTRLTETLQSAGHRVTHLGRTRKRDDVRTFLWDLEKMEMDSQALSEVDSIVHLAGAGIADKPWTKKRKREILESRTKTTRLLYENLKRNPGKVRSFVSASAIGYYGFDDPRHVYMETDDPGSDFQAEVAHRWESAADDVRSLGIRVVKLRTAVVLSRTGGALEELIRPIRLYVGAPLGSGEQCMNWIHIDDLCAMYLQAITDTEMIGPYNATSPHPVTNKHMTKMIAEVLDKPIWLPAIPAFVLKFLLGEMADMVLNGGPISSTRIRESGFVFRYSDLSDALKDVLLTGH
jgi:uncharacterized protein (TIGR01777 family)